MNKILFWALCVFAGGMQAATAQTTMAINAGTYIIGGGPGTVVMGAGNLVNNGDYLDTLGTFLDAGGITYSGSGATGFYNFTINNTGTAVANSLVSVYNTATLQAGNLHANNNIYIRSDVSGIANMIVTGVLIGNVQGIIATATPNTGYCPAYSSDLSVNISGGVLIYQWQSSPDSSVWSDISGATLSTLHVIGFSTTWYRCNISATNSAYAETTPGAKITLSIAGTITSEVVGDGVPNTVCPGVSLTLTDPAVGGAWTSSNPAVATINADGRVTGVTSGTVTISYYVSNFCGTDVATDVITVNALPDAGTITGATSVCSGGTTMLTDTAGSSSGLTPNWGTENFFVAEVDEGLVTGGAAGTATITYTLFNSCGASTAYITVTVSPVPTPGDITGTTNVYIGGTTALTDAPGAGVWSSSATSIAVISTSGVVTGISTGTTAISYTVTDVCSVTVTTQMTVTTVAAAGGAVTMTIMPGTYFLANSTGQVVMDTGRIVNNGAYLDPGGTLIAAGGVTIGGTGVTNLHKLTIDNAQVTQVNSLVSVYNTTDLVAGTLYANNNLYVRSDAGTLANMVVTGVLNGNVKGIIARASVTTGGCPSYTSVLSLDISGAALRYQWQSSADSVAWGDIGGATASTYTATVTATVYYRCNLATTNSSFSEATPGVRLNLPGSLPITGILTVCPGAHTVLSDGTSGGVWSSGTPGVATVGSTGIVTGVSTGVATIGYTTSCWSATATVTVNTQPSAAPVNNGPMCNGGSVILFAMPSGGATAYSWSGPGGMVSILQNPIVIPVVTTTYSLSVSGGACSQPQVYTTTVSVNPMPTAAPNNSGPVCAGNMVTLTANPAGGANAYSWTGPGGFSSTLANPEFSLTVSGTYSLTVSSGPGSGCTPTWNVYTTTVTVNAAPTVGTTGGGVAICSGATATLSGTGAGSYSWSDGIANGVAFTPSAGIHSYTVTGTTSGCSNTAATTITVNTTSAGTVAGASSVNVGASITLTDAVSGGTWSASNGSATVSGGLVTGVAAGLVTISYSMTGSCGSASATKLVSVGVGTTTVTVSPISGYYFYLCAGANATFWDATTGGAWSISPASVATVSATGVVTGVSAGTATLSYTYSGTSVTATVTVYATPAAISGSSNVCVGSTTALSDATPGGTWSSASVTIAAISTAGVVTGSMAGTSTIYYTGTAGCKSSLVVTVVTTPSGIGGATSVCMGSSISLSDLVGGGTWSSTAPASILSTGSASALVAGLSTGTATITYSLGTSCYKTYNVTVKAIPTPILGNRSVCGVGAVTFLSDATAGTSWTVSPVGTATVSPSGRVYGVSVGTATVTYTGTNTCITTTIVTINALVAVAPVTGASSVSHGATITLSDITAGGVWSSSNPALGSVDAVGDVTGVGTSGTVTISYTIPYGSGCFSTTTKPITVHTPAPREQDVTNTTGGAGIDVSSGSTGGDEIATATELNSIAASFDVRLVPNPNKGTFIVKGTVGSGRDEAVTMEVTNMLGQVVFGSKTIATGGVINEQIKLDDNLTNGMYLLSISDGSERKVFHFVMTK